MGKKTITLEFDEQSFDVIEIIKSDRCSVKECNNYGTNKHCSLNFCDNHERAFKD